MTRRDFRDRGGGWVVAQIPVLLAAALVPPWTGGSPALGLEHPGQWAGMLMTFGGLFVSTLGALALGRHITTFPRPPHDAPLRQRGVYAWVRHPIYAGLLLAGLGWTLWWMSLSGLSVVAAAAVFFDRKAAREEAWLRQRYRSYAAYQRRVKKFIPGVY